MRTQTRQDRRKGKDEVRESLPDPKARFCPRCEDELVLVSGILFDEKAFSLERWCYCCGYERIVARRSFS
jgi:hypothetical protein